MPISVDWGNKVITIPQSYCTLITGTLYELDTVQFWADLKALEADAIGIVFDDTQIHNPSYTVAGVTYAQAIQIANGYQIVFTPNSPWSVRLANSNNNFFDVENGILAQNQVQVIAQNSAGLQVVTSGSGVTPQDKIDIANQVWSTTSSGGSTYGDMMDYIRGKMLTVGKFLGLK